MKFVPNGTKKLRSELFGRTAQELSHYINEITYCQLSLVR